MDVDSKSKSSAQDIAKAETPHQSATKNLNIKPVEKPHFSNYFPENKRVVFTHGLAPPLDIDRHAFLCVYRI